MTYIIKISLALKKKMKQCLMCFLKIKKKKHQNDKENIRKPTLKVHGIISLGLFLSVLVQKCPSCFVLGDDLHLHMDEKEVPAAAV